MKKLAVFWGIIIIGLLIAGFIYLINIPAEYDISNKFGISGEVIKHGIYEPVGINDVLNDFQKFYDENKEKGKKTYLLYGNADELTLSTYENIEHGDIKISVGQTVTRLSMTEKRYLSEKLVPIGSSIDVTINDEKYHVKLKGNEMVYFFITEND